MSSGFKYTLSQEQRSAIADMITSLNDFESAFMETVERYNFTVVSEKQFRVIQNILAKVGWSEPVEPPQHDPNWLSKELQSIHDKLDILLNR